jgi:hypothetical protein
MFRMPRERSRQDEALLGRKKPSLWRRLFDRLRGSDAEVEKIKSTGEGKIKPEQPPRPPPPGPGSIGTGV